MDLQEPVGINVPDSLRKAAWKLKAKSHARCKWSIRLIASVDSLTSTSRARVSRFCLIWRLDRILVYNRPGEGPNLGDPRLRDTLSSGRVPAQMRITTHPMVEYTYVSDQVPDEGIPWQVQSNLCLIKTQKKLPFWPHPNYHGQLSRDDAIS